jgi:hypothetical protein
MTHTTKSEYKRIGKPKGYKSNGKGETGYDSSEDSQPTEPSTDPVAADATPTSGQLGSSNWRLSAFGGSTCTQARTQPQDSHGKGNGTVTVSIGPNAKDVGQSA